MGKLSGKTCVVTAGAQGIGRAIAEAFKREDGDVIAVDMQRQVLQAWATPAGVRTAVLDATDEKAIERWAVELGPVQVLVNCVGAVATGTVLDGATQDLERSFRINVVTMASMIRAFLPGMRARRDGSIINIASVVSSVKAAPERFIYGTTKAAVIGLTKSVARDFISEGVRCNSISPGTVESPSLQARMAAQGDVEKARAAFIARQPMGRLGTPEEIAAVATLLASDEARFMTGENIIIDGGMSL
ncbi:NAD(P)-dependent oxidoreductase [Steroidobacter agaridevorans]|uniref:NAD(P)-dependent oxidoreductase n=1 Tax=Steroidobacter agaridevorans TaxID=2695856 RepID=A0A829YJQ6_9GAMM|nr:SDR family oxidoreductase [Steroidobacter agaridevorans]GFE83439.1 NAD(P)-dependent oxidoreductase [Steroidobacter agaridevorans]GFE86680.1 NAD(P)-dependent oxidoreductase [Steroidobacter agaridevorans]